MTEIGYEMENWKIFLNGFVCLHRLREKSAVGEHLSAKFDSLHYIGVGCPLLYFKVTFHEFKLPNKIFEKKNNLKTS